ERRWTVGEEIGWQIRFERRFSARTRLLVATEGVLTGRLQQDPLLSDFRTIVLDEFHERSIHADLAIALARQAWRARNDLRVDVVPLHGSLDAAAQDAAIRRSPRSRRRVVVATNIAETSLTVSGVTAVVDSGFHKVARYDAERGIDSLALERITHDSADQRAG